MILQALKEYYDRKAADPDSGIAPFGWQWKAIPFVVMITSDGRFVSLNDTRDGNKGRLFLVPQEVKRTGKKFVANVLWDKVEYVFGLPVEDGDPKLRNLQLGACDVKTSAFRLTVDEYARDPEVKAVQTFLSKDEEVVQIKKSPLWDMILKENSNLIFKVAGGAETVCASRMFREEYDKHVDVADTDEGVCGACLITGEHGPIQRTHASIKNVLNSQTSGANIISFNKDAFCSYGKEQGYNAPVGKRSAFAYTTALNTLLSPDSRQHLKLANASVVFWSDKESRIENEFNLLFDDPKSDNPDDYTEKVSAILQSIKSGAYLRDDSDVCFYVLGLDAAAKSRLFVRYWYKGTVLGMARRIEDWFVDTALVHDSYVKDNVPLKWLLRSTVKKPKKDKEWDNQICPRLAADVVRSILDARPLPESLLHQCIRRLKVGFKRSDEKQKKEYGRLSYFNFKLIKACLNRKIRFNQIKEKELAVMLDKENSNVGYCLGRLFAVLEKVQEEANPGLNATIRDKYYASASATPATVFGTLMRLKNHHLAKLENQGRKVNFERLLGEIVDKLPKFPAHLKMDDQGQFAIGYYHQRQDFFTKKEQENN